MPAAIASPAAQRRLLAATPGLILDLIGALPSALRAAGDGPGRWTIHEILAHLVDLEESERGWMPRLTHILDGQPGALPRVAAALHLAAYAAAPTPALAERFRRGRSANLARLARLRLDAAALARTGRHPDLGPLTAGQLLAAWAMHDLDHLAQIVGIVGQRQTGAVGPIAAYLRICRPPPRG